METTNVTRKAKKGDIVTVTGLECPLDGPVLNGKNFRVINVSDRLSFIEVDICGLCDKYGKECSPYIPHSAYKIYGEKYMKKLTTLESLLASADSPGKELTEELENGVHEFVSKNAIGGTIRLLYMLALCLHKLNQLEESQS